MAEENVGEEGKGEETGIGIWNKNDSLDNELKKIKIKNKKDFF